MGLALALGAGAALGLAAAHVRLFESVAAVAVFGAVTAGAIAAGLRALWGCWPDDE